MGQNESTISRQGFAQAPPLQRTLSKTPRAATPCNPPLTASNTLRRVLSRTSLNPPPSGRLSRSPSRAETVQLVPSAEASSTTLPTNSTHPSPAPQESPSPRQADIPHAVPASSRNLEVSLAARPLSIASINSAIIPPPPYTPIDEQALALAQDLAVPEIPDDPSEPQTPVSSTRRRSEWPHRGPSNSGGAHRRTSSTSSGNIHQRQLPPTPVDTQPSVASPISYHSDHPETPPSVGTRYTSFQVQQPSQYDGGAALSRESSVSSAQHPRRRNSGSNILEDPLALLRKYDTVIIVDDSVSMEGPLWWEARAALADIAGLAALYDVDGVDLYFVNDRTEGCNLRSAEEVEDIFDSVRPKGVDSELGGRLEEFLLDYLGRLERYKAALDSGKAANLSKVKPVNYIVITDGVPTDDPESVIVSAARRLDNGHFPLSQVGIQFVQIGDDNDAAAALKHLDDGLSKAHGIRDIVDWTHLESGDLEANTLTKILLGGINRRVDGKG